jgi:hypothetical protein
VDKSRFKLTIHSRFLAAAFVTTAASAHRLTSLDSQYGGVHPSGARRAARRAREQGSCASWDLEHMSLAPWEQTLIADP